MVRVAGIKGSEWTVCVGGFRDVEVIDVESLLSEVGEKASPCIFQLFDADRVAGWEHIYFAAVNAMRAFESGSAFSKNPAVEILLYASCQDQISRAFDLLGLSGSTGRVALCIVGNGHDCAVRAFEDAGAIIGTEDDSVLQINGAKSESLRRTYSISGSELRAVGGAEEEALTSLIVERGALLPTHR